MQLRTIQADWFSYEGQPELIYSKFYHLESNFQSVFSSARIVPPILFVFFMDRISRHSQAEGSVRLGDLIIASLFLSDDVVLLASSICSQVWSSCDESQHLQVWGRGSLPENGELLPLGWEWVAMQEFKYLVVHKWGQNGVWDRQADWWTVSSDEGVVPDCCGEEGAELEGKAFGFWVDLCSNPMVMSFG